MKRFRKLLLAVGLCALVAVGGIVVTTSPAAAAASCYGDWCSGQDPSTTGVNGTPCANDARTVDHVDLTVWKLDYPGAPSGAWVKVGDLDLRWSDRCGTNWARVSLMEATGMHSLFVTQSTGYEQSKWTAGWVGGTYPGVFWTRMIYSPTVACRAWVDSGNFQVSSTRWR